MPLTLSAIARAVDGSCLSQRLSERTPVDGVARFDEVVVVGHPAYATLVTGDPAALLDRLDAGGPEADALSRAVLVTDADDPALRERLAAHGTTAILGCALGGVALHATLAALLADDLAASDRLVAAGMKVLTQAARRGGSTAAIAELAHRIDGWAVLLDAQGQLITSAGAGRLHVSDATAVALGRPVRVRHEGLQLHQVGSDRDLAGYLVISTRSGTVSRSRDLASLAAALFDLLLRSHDPSVTEHLGRESLMRTIIDGGAPALELLRRWGVHDRSLTAFALGARTRTIDAERLLRRWFDELGAEHVFAASQGRVLGFVRDDLIDELAKRVDELTPVSGQRLHLGIGTPSPADALARGAAQAGQALDTALDESRTVVHYARLASVELVLGSLAAEPRAELARALDPLRDATGAHGELTEALRVFLAENGRHRASAELLGIHRQTLVSRLRRVEELTGLSMEHADDRATAWIALRALDR